MIILMFKALRNLSPPSVVVKCFAVRVSCLAYPNKKFIALQLIQIPKQLHWMRSFQSYTFLFLFFLFQYNFKFLLKLVNVIIVKLMLHHLGIMNDMTS